MRRRAGRSSQVLGLAFKADVLGVEQKCARASGRMTRLL